MKKKGIIGTLLTYVLIIGIAMYLISVLSEVKIKEMSYTELMQKIESTDVSEIKLSNDRQTAEVKLKEESDITRVVKIPATNSFMETIEPKVVAGEFELDVKDESAWEALAPLLPNLLLLLGTLFIFIFMIKKTTDGNNKAMSFGKNRARMVNKDDKKKITFDKVAGLKEEKEE